MCQRCGQPSFINCGCVQQTLSPCAPCSNPGPCPILLDTQCIIYHKDNNTLSGLVALGLNNGSTLQLILDTIDVKLRAIDVNNWTLPCLRTIGPITTLQAFGQLVDTRLCEIQTEIDDLVSEAAVPLVANDSNSIDFSTSGTLDHTLTGNVKISATAGNQTSILADGLVTTPQTLSVNPTTKELTISDGNTVSFAALVCGVGGYLGNFTADPTAADGQYWYRTDLSANLGLRIKLNGIVKTITIS